MLDIYEHYYPKVRPCGGARLERHYMRNELKPGASIPRDSWSPEKSSRLSVLLAMLALLVPTLVVRDN